MKQITVLFSLLCTALLIAGCGSSGGHSAKNKPDPRKGYLSLAETAKLNDSLKPYSKAYDDNTNATKVNACTNKKGVTNVGCITALRNPMRDATAGVAKTAHEVAAAKHNTACTSALTTYVSFTDQLAQAWKADADAWAKPKNNDAGAKADGAGFALTDKFKDQRKALANACWARVDKDKSKADELKAREGYFSQAELDTLNASFKPLDKATAVVYDGKSAAKCNGLTPQVKYNTCILKVIGPMAPATATLDKAAADLQKNPHRNECTNALAAYREYTQQYAKAWASDVAVWHKTTISNAEAKLSAKAYALDNLLRPELKKLSDGCASPVDTEPHLQL